MARNDPPWGCDFAPFAGFPLVFWTPHLLGTPAVFPKKWFHFFLVFPPGAEDPLSLWFGTPKRSVSPAAPLGIGCVRLTFCLPCPKRLLGRWGLCFTLHRKHGFRLFPYAFFFTRFPGPRSPRATGPPYTTLTFFSRLAAPFSG